MILGMVYAKLFLYPCTLCCQCISINKKLHSLIDTARIDILLLGKTLRERNISIFHIYKVSVIQDNLATTSHAIV